ncbi:hypothetical protein HDK64DRAFT_43227 [Phyllosticta capitalensis]
MPVVALRRNTRLPLLSSLYVSLAVAFVLCRRRGSIRVVGVQSVFEKRAHAEAVLREGIDGLVDRWVMSAPPPRSEVRCMRWPCLRRRVAGKVFSPSPPPALPSAASQHHLGNQQRRTHTPTTPTPRIPPHNEAIVSASSPSRWPACLDAAKPPGNQQRLRRSTLVLE